MNRSSGSPTFGGGLPKRFDTMRSSPQMQLQQQMHHLHQQQQQQHQQYQHNAAVAAAISVNMPFFPNLNTPPPGVHNMNRMNSMNGMNSIMSFPNPNPAPNPYLYNANASMQARMWKYNLPATPPLGYDGSTQPPLPLLPPQQPPPLPPPEQEPPNFAVANTYIPSSMSVSTGCKAAAAGYEDVCLVNNKKMKRKSMSNRSGCSKQWDREDALKAIAVEKEYSKKDKSKILLLRFPDPELSREIVKQYSPQIESVHFQQDSAPRFCFVQLKEDADIDKEIENLSQISFGNGFIKVELKHLIDAPQSINPEEIDPYTLYIGNLPKTISSRTVKEHFPGAHRIDIGHAMRMKNTRYAIVRYHTVEESIDAFRKCLNTLKESRSPIVRFRRFPCSEQKRQRKEPAPVVPPALATSNVDATPDAQIVQEAEKELDTDKGTKVSEPLSAPVLEERINTTEPNSQLEAFLTATALDSSNSLEEPEQMQVLPVSDSKDKVLIEAEQLKSKMPTTNVAATNAPQLRSSIEEMFAELEHREREAENIAASVKTTELRIKKETENLDAPSENVEQLSLLGARYKEGESQIKIDPDASPTTDEPNMPADDIYQDDFNFDEEFDSEPEETIANALPGSCAMEAHKTSVTSSASTSHNTNWEIIRKKELEDVEDKPAVEELTLASHNKTSCCLPFPFPAHLSDIEKLYEEQRQFKKREDSKRPRDDWDDVFARMDSDSEEDEDNFF